jgi:hypothetical protein
VIKKTNAGIGTSQLHEDSSNIIIQSGIESLVPGQGHEYFKNKFEQSKALEFQFHLQN